MSVTVIAVPYALAWIAGTLTTTLIAAEAANKIFEEKMALNEAEKLNDLIVENDCQDFQIISEANLMQKSLETPFVDREILLKTLDEHGVKNIREENGKITGEVDKYSLAFEKENEEKPYFLTITYSEEGNLEEKINDLNSEYSMNVQEDVYLNMIEKLKENNMEIEDEEVLDDNTIVLTVNLEY